MISVQNLSMHFTGEDLFTDINFLIREKDRIGLVGKNGAGKTTLIRLLCGLEQPHKGEVIVPEDVTIGYLPQEKDLSSNLPVLQEALTAFEEFHRLEAQLKTLETQIQQRTDFESESYHKLIEKLSFYNERIALLGANAIEGEAERILVGLGFVHDDMSRKMSEFSNGWQMRVELAKILLSKPALLLLDEPTNHLDIEAIQWLEGFLQTYYGAILMVSHDRTFLDNITIRTIEISNGRIYDYKGSYSHYIEARESRIDTQQAAYNNQQKEIKEIENFIERFRYKATKSKQVQSRVKLLEKMDEVVVDDMEKSSIHFKFPPAPHAGKITLETDNLSKNYGSLQVLNKLNLLITRGERIAFVGKNGEGKSTLSKILAGVLDYEGDLKLGHQVKVGYYAQNQHDMLDAEKTVFETLDEVAVGEVRARIKSLLGSFLFGGDAIDKKVKVLSGGEKARLSLAKMLLFPVNLLILDEPTNHLDMMSKDILKSALLRYDGTLLIVSHDRDFLQGLTNKVYEFRKPHIKVYDGDIFDFLERRKLEHLKQLEIKQSQEKTNTASNSVNKQNYGLRKQRDKQIRKVEKEIQDIETAIHSQEKQIAEMDLVLASPDEHQDVVTELWYKRYAMIKKEVSALMNQWENKQLEKESLESESLKYQ
ncbi:MAG: ATP-binding cassette domain-containing protein [Bacteroidetes bacterium]|nr:ATP-binding cassette domain-containing protein [Bacteroidota bacterium]MBU1578571.1 ATP-binding cassette domain-containing protein [Bacteroidota bacterium]MBU2557545.1 ATP-binding cassette domain-containing protein [Bacteroidota bacterium]